MRSPLVRSLLIGFVALAAASCQSPPVIHGRVTTRTRVTLPANAVLEVQISDVSPTDAAPTVLARRVYTPLGAAPWRFTLRADSVRSLDRTHVYAVQARVLVDGKPRLVSRRRTLVDPARLADTLDVVVEPVPRTVGTRLAAPMPGVPRLWNPPGGPATLPAPIPPLVASLAAGSAPDRARGLHCQPERPECPPSPVH